jgi:probable rRNA maturation factor
MSIELSNDSGQSCDEEALVSVAGFAMARMGINSDSDLSITLVAEEKMSELHLQWMDLPGPTDVLSFPMDEMKPFSAEVGMLGDIVLCPTIAAAQSHSSDADHEMALLTVHGVLHLLGYDHAEAEEEKAMFSLQETLLNEWQSQR